MSVLSRSFSDSWKRTVGVICDGCPLALGFPHLRSLQDEEVTISRDSIAPSELLNAGYLVQATSCLNWIGIIPKFH